MTEIPKEERSLSLAPAPRVMKPIELAVFDCDIRIDCVDSHTESLLVANYGWFKRGLKDPQLQYCIDREPISHRVVIARDGLEPMVASDDGEFLFLFEKDMTIELQKRRRDLYFIHSAALEFAGKAFLLVAPSGGGKSTITWGLLHHGGLHYLSDELAPVRLKSMEIYPYPHAICLKQKQPQPYLLPDRTLYTSRTMHVPTEFLPGEIGERPTPLIAIFFLQLGHQPSVPGIARVSNAEAAARLYANSLNSLAHKGEGLDAVIEIAKNNLCFQLTIGELSSTCALVKDTLQGIARSQD